MIGGRYDVRNKFPRACVTGTGRPWILLWHRVSIAPPNYAFLFIVSFRPGILSHPVPVFLAFFFCACVCLSGLITMAFSPLFNVALVLIGNFNRARHSIRYLVLQYVLDLFPPNGICIFPLLRGACSSSLLLLSSRVFACLCWTRNTLHYWGEST